MRSDRTLLGRVLRRRCFRVREAQAVGLHRLLSILRVHISHPCFAWGPSSAQADSLRRSRLCPPTGPSSTLRHHQHVCPARPDHLHGHLWMRVSSASLRRPSPGLFQWSQPDFPAGVALPPRKPRRGLASVLADSFCAAQEVYSRAGASKGTRSSFHRRRRLASGRQCCENVGGAPPDRRGKAQACRSDRHIHN